MKEKITLRSAWHAIVSRVRMSVAVSPVSFQWGTDRGLPVHRFYLEQFLNEFSDHVRGHCLEFQDPMYVPTFGGAAVSKLDILHIDAANPQATLFADLTKPNNLPSNHFACVVCTHILHVIFDVEKAVKEIFHILRPTEVLLVAVPHISICEPDYHEIWRFTSEGLHILLARIFGATNVILRSYGNSLTAAGAE